MLPALWLLLFCFIQIFPPAECSDTRDDIIRMYFSCGYSYNLIVCFLYFVHGISISLRQLKRVLRCLNLRRRRTVDRSIIRRAVLLIHDELGGSGSLLGYRSLWRRLQSQYGLYVPRDVIMRLLADIAPEDSSLRRQHRLTRRVYRNKGPNYVWHTDGCDKLKPYGFAIHGCIDGYSRRVLWLHVGTSNNNPRIVAFHYLKYVEEVGGMARILRSDCGTENSNLAFIQPYLRRSHTDCFAEMESFRYGKSTTNQRIEAWWSQLKRKFTHWWSTFFKRMQEYNLYDNSNFVHVDCLRLCFMDLIQLDLNRVRMEWNSHRIRPSRMSDCPSGHPNELYFMPAINGTEDYLCQLDTRDLPSAYQHAEAPDPPASLEFLQAAKYIMADNNILYMPTNIQSALNLYVVLTTTFEQFIS